MSGNGKITLPHRLSHGFVLIPLKTATQLGKASQLPGQSVLPKEGWEREVVYEGKKAWLRRWVHMGQEYWCVVER